jgi:hypothetical protein
MPIFEVNKTVIHTQKVPLELPYCGMSEDTIKTKYVLIAPIPKVNGVATDKVNIKVILITEYKHTGDTDLSISTHSSDSYYFNISDWTALDWDEWDNIIGDYRNKLEEL